MKTETIYKQHRLVKGSKALELFLIWKSSKDDKEAKVNRKKFEDHFKSVLDTYEKSL
jgi:hypothetical protein